ncbi:hypothetical protein [Granulicella tundricola]|uniref:Copper resistance protein CopC n=1 Tax=Granulicella tundricola (strain ATCC BAA-1859 / DSM 23138 / MP5ACTX9) TaxID=1198114 RepID=E8WWZ2_GRATM|nr:hypothetical protein [Granulicella tundricola]ADW68553.1 copper resistance protein CopC [Granulicella tundricola MP5ACTX9]
MIRFFVVLMLMCPPVLYGQGCSQCREAVGQTPARTQVAYRRGITFMMLAGAGVFAGAVLAMRRFR